ncbi:MAG: TonB-dependent receptor [Acidobacteria bacterium]|nr:MAG: TonB-dependent receptor [Acidobacteriota bacterium]
MRFRKISAVAAILLFGTAFTVAQEYRGRVQGVVADTTGGVLPGASLVLTSTGTGVAVTRVSNDEGRYIFDYVDPGTYSLAVELPGFKKTIQQNILVQQRGDVTVDVKLEVGEVTESLTVEASPVSLQFNTASRDLTIETKMVKELPSLTRNPFQLAMLDPTILNRGNTSETQPYHHRTSNEMDIGGGTKYRNDVLLDGTPLTAGNKLGYTPPMDAVTEYTIQQNSVDAEFGHSAGGIAVVTMKSGTNEVHGSGYYYGRDPSLNAITDRAIPRHSESPYWNAGGTIGLPLLKNKLFIFGVFEKIENTQASPGTYTLPTDLERQGDFSQSLTKDGKMRVIYDPTTTKLGPDGKTYIREAFPNNIIPAARWDPVAAKLLGGLWKANASADDKTGLNNFKYLNELKFHYYNFSSRVDWQINEKWKAFGRVSRMKTDQDQVDFTDGGDPMKIRNVTGSKRNGWNVAADTVYTVSPTTTFNIRGSYYMAEDKRDYPEMALTDKDYADLWNSVSWWKSGSADYMAGRPLLYFPHMVVDNNNYGRFGVQNFWYQQPSGYSVHGRYSKYLTKHWLKAGTEVRWKRGSAARFYFGDFRFSSQETGKDMAKAEANTGHPWASFLLGAINPSASNVRYNVLQYANTEMYAFYLQDDFKVTQNLTLNLGLRYEYEGGLWDPENRLPQRLDLTDPIPGMQAAIDPLIAADVKAKMAESTGQKSYLYNGAFYFTEDGRTRKTNMDKNGWMPRIGVAWRVGDKTVVRAGYGRFVVPSSLANSERDTLGEIDLGGFTPTTPVPSVQQGVPRAYLANPFPLGLNPITGKEYGRYTNLGSAVTIDEYDQRPPISDRINVSVQRELPGRFIADVTYFTNFVSRDQFSRNLNMADPRLSYKYKADLEKTVPNPFYNYGTPETFPNASLRNSKTVKTSTLLVPYPQYGAITQTGTDLRQARYQSMQIRMQRPFHRGFSLLASYAFVKSRSQWFFDDQDEYDGKLTWMDFSVTQSGGAGSPQVTSDPKHRFVSASAWEIPVGRGRWLGSDMSGVLDQIVGGWQLSALYSFTSGAPLIFTRNMIAPSSAAQIGDIGSGSYWFDTTGFAKQAAYTRRTNPWYYDGLNGPGYSNLDLSFSKKFSLTERFRLEVRLDAFNALNGMNWVTPQLDETKSDFGKTNTQLTGYYGRQLQYSARVEF